MTQQVPENFMMFSTTVTEEAKDIVGLLKRKQSHLKWLGHPDMAVVLRQLDALPSIGEVQYMSVWQGWADDPHLVEFHLQLKDSVKDPQIARDLVRLRIASKLVKKVAYGGGSLKIEGDLFPEMALAFKVRITIDGYVPSTCKVIYEDVVIPEHTERKAKVICGPDELDASATGTDLEEEITA